MFVGKSMAAEYRLLSGSRGEDSERRYRRDEIRGPCGKNLRQGLNGKSGGYFADPPPSIRKFPRWRRALSSRSCRIRATRRLLPRREKCPARRDAYGRRDRLSVATTPNPAAARKNDPIRSVPARGRSPGHRRTAPVSVLLRPRRT